MAVWAPSAGTAGAAGNDGRMALRIHVYHFTSSVPLSFSITAADAGQRLDHYLHAQFPELSRSRIQSWIKEGRALVDGSAAKASAILHGRETIEVSPADLPPLKAEPEDLPVEILYEDAAVIAIYKPAGLVVHAGAGAHSGTLVNRLVHHFASLSRAGGELRPGIVHRLDRGTSGVILVARTDAAHRALAAQFAGRTVEKTYLALVEGRIAAESGRVTTPITRDPVRRTRMTARLGRGRSAITEFRIVRRFENFTYLEVRASAPDGRTRFAPICLRSGIRWLAIVSTVRRRASAFSACVEDWVHQSRNGPARGCGSSTRPSAGAVAGGSSYII